MEVTVCVEYISFSNNFCIHTIMDNDDKTIFMTVKNDFLLSLVCIFIFIYLHLDPEVWASEM